MPTYADVYATHRERHTTAAQKKKKLACKGTHASRDAHDSCRLLSVSDSQFPAYVSMRQHTSAFVSICQLQVAQRLRLPVRACIRQHAAAYVSIRQRTTAYDSVRQRTSAYGSIRQHAAAYDSMRRFLSVCMPHEALSIRHGVKGLMH
jgi:hypothetical protein